MINGINPTHIQGVELEDYIHNGKGIVGSFVKNNGKVKLINLEGEYDHLEGTEIEIINEGTWYVNKIKVVQERINIELELFDYGYKFDRIYQPEYFQFPMTSKQWAKAICDVVGIEFIDSDWPNCNFELESQPFVGPEDTYRDVISMIAGSGGCFGKILKDKLFIGWFSNKIHEIRDWFSLKQNPETTPVNVIVLGRGDLEDNIYFPSPLPQNPFELRIDENQIQYFHREEMIQAIYTQINGFKFYPIEMSTYGNLDLKSGDKISYTDIYGANIITHIMNHKKVFNGGWKSTIINIELEETSTKFQHAGTNERRINKTEAIVDKQGEQILLLVDTTAQNSQAIINNQNLIIQTAQSTTNTIRSTGGSNNIRDSALYKNDDEEWIKSANVVYEIIRDTETKKNTKSESELRLYNGTFRREFTLVQGNRYNLSFKYKKQALVPNKVSYVRLYSSTSNYIDYLRTTAAQTSRTEVDFSFIASTSTFTIEYSSDNDNFYISDVRITNEEKQEWSPFFDEVMGIGHVLDQDGLELSDPNTATKLKADDDSIVITNNGNVKAELSDEKVYAQEADFENKVQIHNMGIIRLDDNNYIIAKVV